MTNSGEGDLPAESDTADPGPTVMVPVLNPRTERALISLASVLATHRDGRVLAVHVVTVPDQTALSIAAENREQIDAASSELLEAATRDAAEFDVPIDTKTILSHRGIEAIFAAARSEAADAVVMGYGPTKVAGGRVEGALDELAHDLPCDFLILDAESFDPTDVLVPTVGGPSSALSAEIVRALRAERGVDPTLLHVVEEGAEAAGRDFLSAWAQEQDLAAADQLVAAGDPREVICRLGERYSLVVLGASERGLVSRIVHGSPALEAVESLDVPVLLAERPGSRSLWERLFGRWG